MSSSSHLDHLQDALPVDPHVLCGQLENGLRYYIRSNKRPENRAELRLVVRAGSILEDDDQQGLAHIVEHMAFNGTTRFGARELVGYFESIGARFGAHLNAHTGFDETVYKLQIPMDDPEILKKSFWILRDWASELLFLPEEIERERKVGLEEWRQGRGAMARVREQLLPRVYHGSKYVERLPIGTEESLLGFEHDALIRFYKTWYRPELMSVLVVGDFDVAQIQEHITAHFADLQAIADAPPRVYEQVPMHDEVFYDVLYDNEIPQSSLAIMAKFPEEPKATHEAYRKNIVFELGLRGFNERLALLSQLPNAPFLGAQSGRQQLNINTSADILSAAIPAGQFEKCTQALMIELRRICRFGLTPGELERAKKRYTASIDAAYDERDATPSRVLIKELVRAVTLAEPIPGVTYERDMVYHYLPDISLEEVNQELNRWMSSSSQLIHIISGEAEHPTVEALSAWVEEAQQADIMPPQEESCEVPLLTHKPTPGNLLSRRHIEEIDIQEWVLSNGVKVWLKKTDFQADRILFSLRQNGGLLLAEDDELVPASTAASIAFRSGAGPHSLPQLQKILSGSKMRMKPYYRFLSHGFQGLCSTEDLEKMLQLFYLQSQQPRFSEEAFLREKELREEKLRNKFADPATVFADEFNRLWWSDHLRHQPWSVDSLVHMNLQESANFFQRTMQSIRGTHCVLVGNVNEDVLAPLLERYLDVPSENLHSPIPNRGEERVRGIVQACIYAGVEPVARYRMRTIARVENNLENRVSVIALGELLRIQLRRQLREERGDVYAVQVEYRDSLYPEEAVHISIEFGCDPQKLDELIQVLYNEIDEFHQHPPRAEDLENVKMQMLRSYESQQRENDAWMAQLFHALRRTEDPANILLFPKVVAQLQPQSLQQAAITFLNIQDRVELKMLPKTTH